MIRALATFGKLLLAGIATLVMVELALLAFDGVFFARSFYGFDPDIGFRVRPHAGHGANRANEFGFNDRDYPHERAPGTYRIVVLGDSFNWTFGPDGNYAGVLEQMLRERFPDRGIEVINAGYPQTHTGQQLAVLRKFAMRYQPDLVVLGFFVGNDFYDADPDRKRIVVGGAAVDVGPGDFYREAFGQPLVWKSRLALILAEKWKELQVRGAAREQFREPKRVDRVRGANPSPELRATKRAPTAPGYLAWLERRMDFARADRAQAFRRHEKYVYDSLLAMRDLLASAGTDFLVVAYPDAVQVDSVVRRTLLERTGRQASDYEWTRAQRLLREFCAEHGIAHLDLLDGFRAAHRAGWALYLENDSHWNAAGNVLAAELLFDALAPRFAPTPTAE